jgi:hypothetical protein
MSETLRQSLGLAIRCISAGAPCARGSVYLRSGPATPLACSPTSRPARCRIWRESWRDCSVRFRRRSWLVDPAAASLPRPTHIPLADRQRAVPGDRPTLRRGHVRGDEDGGRGAWEAGESVSGVCELTEFLGHVPPNHVSHNTTNHRRVDVVPLTQRFLADRMARILTSNYSDIFISEFIRALALAARE